MKGSLFLCFILTNRINLETCSDEPSTEQAKQEKRNSGHKYWCVRRLFNGAGLTPNN